MTELDELREHSRMTWIEQEHGWAAAPEEILSALSNDGFEECKRELTTSRRDRQSAGGLWQGVNHRTGSVASAVWVNHAAWPHAIVFIEVDGESLTGGDCGRGEPWTRTHGSGRGRVSPPGPPSGRNAPAAATQPWTVICMRTREERANAGGFIPWRRRATPTGGTGA
jgi:hypothetical protein